MNCFVFDEILVFGFGICSVIVKFAWIEAMHKQKLSTRKNVSSFFFFLLLLMSSLSKITRLVFHARKEEKKKK